MFRRSFNCFETEFRRDERVAFLTVSLDKHAISWAERRRKLKSKKLKSWQSASGKKDGIRYLTPLNIETNKQKKLSFQKSGIKYIDYKDGDFLLKFMSKENSSSSFNWNFIKISKKSFCRC
jgi:ribosomal protein S18